MTDRERCDRPELDRSAAEVSERQAGRDQPLPEKSEVREVRRALPAELREKHRSGLKGSRIHGTCRSIDVLNEANSDASGRVCQTGFFNRHSVPPEVALAIEDVARKSGVRCEKNRGSDLLSFAEWTRSEVGGAVACRGVIVDPGRGYDEVRSHAIRCPGFFE